MGTQGNGRQGHFSKRLNSFALSVSLSLSLSLSFSLSHSLSCAVPINNHTHKHKHTHAHAHTLGAHTHTHTHTHTQTHTDSCPCVWASRQQRTPNFPVRLDWAPGITPRIPLVVFVRITVNAQLGTERRKRTSSSYWIKLLWDENKCGDGTLRSLCWRARALRVKLAPGLFKNSEWKAGKKAETLKAAIWRDWLFILLNQVWVMLFTKLTTESTILLTH